MVACQEMGEEEDPRVPCEGVEREGDRGGRGVEVGQVGGLGAGLHPTLLQPLQPLCCPGCREGGEGRAWGEVRVGKWR